MKSHVCLGAAALTAQRTVITLSHAASVSWNGTAASTTSADAGDSPLTLIAGQRGRGNRQNFNANNFHSSVGSNHTVNRNSNVNRNANVNVNRNGGYYGGGCSHYDSGPGWGGVAAGVAVGAVVGAAAASAAPPPPVYYPPGVTCCAYSRFMIRRVSRAPGRNCTVRANRAFSF